MSDGDGVVVDATTRRLVGSLFEYRDLDARTLTGVAEPVAASLALRESAIADRFEALRPARGGLIGRDEELSLLLRRWAHAKTGEGRVVLVWGEPGIGKSHLVAAFHDAIAAEPHVAIRYFCSPHRVQTALHPVVTQIEHAAGFADGDDGDAKRAKLEHLLAMSSRDLAQDVALLAELLSIPNAAGSALAALSAQRRKEMLLERLAAQLAGLASRRPVAMILEDAHWIDPTTRELFDLIVERVRELPILLIVTYRPEFISSWVGQSHVTVLTLNRLGRRENGALVRRIAGERDLPPLLLEQIIRRTDGIPLFIEEVTKSVLESGLLREEHGAYVHDGPLPTLVIPSSLQASLVARLDRIAVARPVIQASAALGREFSYPLVKAVTALTDAEIAASMDALVASGLVHARGSPPHAVYAFKHALVQDAAYEMIPRSERPPIHRRIADVLQREFREVAEHHPDLMALHCTEAGLREKAIEFRIKAARMALDRSAGVEAHHQVQAAIAVLPGIASSGARRQLDGRLQVARAEALVMTTGFSSPAVMEALSRARELLDEDVDPLPALGALCGLFNYHLIRSDSKTCLALAQSRREQGLDRPTTTVLHYLRGTAHLHLGNFAQSIRDLETALSLYEEDVCRPVSFIAGYHLRSFTLTWLGLAYLYAGSLDLAAQTISAAVSDARSRSHPFTLVSALLARARFCNDTRDLAGAVAATEEGMAIAVEQRSPYHVSRASVLRAVNAVGSGRAAEGIARMEEALSAHRATGADFLRAYNLSRLAEAHACAGDGARATTLARQAIAEVERTGERWWEAEAHRIHGEILLAAASPNRDAAEACFERALACARRQNARLWELHAALNLARLWSSNGARERAQRLLAPVCHAFEGVEIVAVAEAKRLLKTPSATTRAASRGRPRP